MDYYDSEYRRQYCRERIARIRDDYRRAQAPSRSEAPSRQRVVARIRANREHVRPEAEGRAPAYRS